MKKLSLIFVLLLSVLLGSSQSIQLTDGAISELCSGFILDPGGNSNYSNSLHYTHIIKSANGGQVQLNFFEFDLASGDELMIFNGYSDELLGTFSGNSLQGDSIKSSSTGALTLVFVSNSSGTALGFKAQISCTYPCQNFSVDIKANRPISSSDKTLLTCPGDTLIFTVEADFPDNQENYTQSLGTSDITWEDSENGIWGTGWSFSLPITEDFEGELILRVEDIETCVSYDTIKIISVCPPIELNLNYTTSVGQAVGVEPAHTGDKIFLAHYSYPLDFGVELDFSENSCYTQEIESITWDFGHAIQANSSPGTFEGENPPSHNFPNVDKTVYQIEIVAKDQMGCEGTKKVKVYVGCQPLKLDYTATPGMDGDMVVACPDDTINIDVTPVPLILDTLYSLAPSLLSYTWQIGSSASADNLFQEDLSNLILSDPGYHDIYLRIGDTSLCSDLFTIPVLQYIQPNLEGTSLSEGVICIGDEIDLLGQSRFSLPKVSGEPVFLPDGLGVSYTSNLDYNIFMPDAKIESVEEIESICTSLEHSFLGDLEIEVICPNGQTAELKEVGGNAQYLGEPYDDDSAPDVVGVGYNYCFVESAPFTLVGAAGGLGIGAYQSIPEGNYRTNESFNALIGCPLNGQWTIKITDHLIQDNGWIFGWEINFRDLDDKMIPDSIMYPYETREWTVDTGGAASIVRYYQDDAHAIPLDTGVYYFKYTLVTAANCGFDTVVGPLVVHPRPEFEISPDTVLCNTLEYEVEGFIEEGSGVWTYQGPNGLVFSDEDTIPTHITVLQEGEYILTFTPNTLIPKCGEPKTCKIDFRRLPEITALVDSVKCYGENSGSIQTQAIGADQPYTYAWSDAQSTARAEDLAAGVYQVTVSSEFCEDVFQYVVEQPFPLEVGSYGHTDNKCFGDSLGSVWAEAVGGTAPYVFQWSNGAMQDSLFNLPSGNYGLTLTDRNHCEAYLIQSVGGPTSPLTLSYQEVKHLACFGDDDGLIDIKVSGGTQPYSYHWTKDGTDFSSEGSLNDLGQGVYKLTISDAHACLFIGDTSISEPSDLQLLHTVIETSCYGAADGLLQVFASAGTPPYSYQWSNGTQDSVAINLLSNYYNVTVTDNNTCSKTIENIWVDQPAPVKISVSESDTICIGESTSLTISATSSPFTPYTFYWNGSESSANLVVSPSVSTTYVAKVIDANGCESQEKERQVNVFDDFSATEAIFDKTEICRGDLVQVHLKPKGGNGHYTFKLSDGSLVDTNFTVTPASTGMVNIIISDNCSTPLLTKSFKLKVNESYLPNFYVEKNSACQPFKVHILQDISLHEEGTVYNWKMRSSQGGNEWTSHEPFPVHQIDSEGFYDLSLELITPKGCKSDKQMPSYIQVYPKPLANFEASEHEVSSNYPKIHFTNKSQGAVRYIWSFGGTGDFETEDVDFQFPPYSESYEVMLVAESAYACKDTAYTTIFVKEEQALYFPTAFTPNGDGRNDKFILKGNGIESYQIQIFDRWGTVIYRGDDLSEGWDGRRGNTKEKMASGSYTFKVELVDSEGKKHQKSGRLVLIR